MGIDLNTVEEEEDEAAPSPPATAAPISPAPAEGGFPKGSVCLELWHACAGPLTSLPRKGSVVVYLPQGHLEHLGDGAALGRYCVPAHVFCRVVDVKLLADAATDEVYAQLSLVAESEEVERQLRESCNEGDGEPEDADGKRRAPVPHMFCKTLTASDTSTHGGFSVPRRAAEDCFPPLDYKQQRPSQELVAKDLHGMEWRFRHIYRGQPRRHLLTTGWSAFVNRKKLVSGDAVLFLRGDDGELRLGIRRAVQLKQGAPFAALYSQISNLSTPAGVANAVSMKSVFHIYYNPRTSPSEFIVPYWKFTKSFGNPFSVGMRFKMRYESEDAGERRYTGMITGIGDIDPIRWPSSKWRCLLVRWDDDVDCSRQNRVSPWEIEPTGSCSGSHSLLTPCSKRTKTCAPMVNPDFPGPNGTGCPDFGESARFHKVLQGQEFLGFKSPHDGIGVATSQATEMRNIQYSDLRRCSTDAASILGGPRSGTGNPVGNSGFKYHCAGFGESLRFQKVLQGQEIFPSYRGTSTDAIPHNGGFGPFDGVHLSGTASRWPGQVQGYAFAQSSVPPTQASSPSSVLVFQQANSKRDLPHFQLLHNRLDKGEDSSQNDNSKLSDVSVRNGQTLPNWPHHIAGDIISEHFEMGNVHTPENAISPGLNDEDVSRKGCRLFGFSLTERIPVTSEVHSSEENNYEIDFPTSEPQLPKSLGRSCATVHKQGSVVGRVIDLSRFDGYAGLICELERLFDMQGLLNDPEKKWHVVYTDNEDDLMLVGDDPWQHFCNIASKILIYTQDEEEMTACRLKMSLVS
ncbi:auxin response factor 15-like isoform X1 [Typha latifolia]|uniref:auxin response factor 15-like isoform X1 n=1 Tax=Typha latifolia TaxID=4733 RepID=UPI003C305CE9